MHLPSGVVKGIIVVIIIIGVWGADMKRCLIVVDYQNDFVSGSLGFEKAKALDGCICEKIREYRKAGGDILFTMDTHGRDYLKTREGRSIPVEHCIKGTNGHCLYGNTAQEAREEDLYFEKSTYGSDALYEYLKTAAYDSIELCGVVSNICVLSNAVLAKTALPESEIKIDARCTASNDDRLNEEVLDVLASINVEITNRV